MDLLDLGGCEDENCNLPSGFPENCSNQECLWDEPVFGLIELVSVTVICILLMLFGLLGNILTILVVWLRPHMRSSTYLYLSSMAVSDLLILLLLPLDLYKLWKPWPWPFGELTCKLTMFLSECCTFCTILHITFLSLERYVAVCWPITAKTLVTRSRTRALIGCLWLGAAVSAAPVLVMVGVVEVGGEEPGVSQWREGGGWTGREGEKGGFMIGGREQGSGHITLMDGGLEGINWEEKDKKELSERLMELKWFGDKEERNLAIGEKDERIHGDQVGGEGHGKNEVEGERQNKMKEDEGGGREEGRYRGETDKRECRCTHYAISSGLLSAMTILSNLYFLVPFCILGLVYSLIGRTLWLRPQSSRREQSHRHTVKMLGVIVLAFVLCWLPFHVGRTIFSFTLGSDRQDANTDASSHLGVSSLPDINRHTVATPVSHSDSDMDVKTGKTSAQVQTERDEIRCGICAKPRLKSNTHAHVDTETETHTDVDTQSDDISADKHSLHTGTSTHHLDPGIQLDTHKTTLTETHSDAAHDDAKLDTSFHSGTNTNTHGNRKCCRDVHTLSSVQNWASQNTPNHTPPTANAYAVTPSDLYNGNTHNDRPFNDTYPHPDTHLHHVLYYLSQYFNLVSSVLFYLSAAVNPLLYNLMSARYRHAVHTLIHTHSHTRSHRLHTVTARHSTTTL